MSCQWQVMEEGESEARSQISMMDNNLALYHLLYPSTGSG